MAELQQLIAERDSLTKKIVAEAKKEFGARVAGIFEAYPELENFAWLQYSHEYDDGEGPWMVYTNVEVENSDKWGPSIDLRASVDRSSGRWSDNTPRSAEVKKLWDQIPDWVYLELFGEDEYVVCYPDRVETIDYHGN